MLLDIHTFYEGFQSDSYSLNENSGPVSPA